MEPFHNINAIALPLIRDNIDTDAIIPSREMKTVSKTGLAEGLFAGWRYTEIGGRVLNPDFILNQPGYQQSRMILGGENFGCGSSREHAVWALHEYGFRAVIAPSFAPIFYNNCVRNGIAPVRLAAADIAILASWVTAAPTQHRISVDLAAQSVCGSEAVAYHFDIDAEAKEMLLEGLDGIDLTLKQRPAIDAWLQQNRISRPWIYFNQRIGHQDNSKS